MTPRAGGVEPPARPRVAIAYGPRSVSVMQLAQAAANHCDVIWLVDGRIEEMAPTARLLKRFGPVVDTGGMTPREAAEALAPHAPAGLVTYFDTGMVALAEMAAHLGLRFHHPDVARTLVDKARQREVLGNAGIDGPGWVVLPDGPGAQAVAAIPASFRWPVVIKPRSESGSHHTFLAGSPEEAAGLVDSVGPGREELVAEEYLPGDPRFEGGTYADYFSVESLVSAGNFSHVAVTGRFPPAPTFRETGFFIPAILPADVQRASVELAERAARAIGVRDGCLHTEVKITPDGPRIIEVNGRLGGGIPDMLELAAGVSLLEHSFRIALGQDPRIDGPLACDRVGYRFFLQPPQITATVAAVDGLQRVADHPGVDNVTVHRGPGAVVDWKDGTRVFVVAVVGSAPDHEHVLEVDRMLREDVSVSYEPLPAGDASRTAEAGG